MWIDYFLTARQRSCGKVMLLHLFVCSQGGYAKCGVPWTLCWKIGKISTSTELFGFNFADNNLKLPNLSIHAFVIIQKSLEVH